MLPPDQRALFATTWCCFGMVYLMGLCESKVQTKGSLFYSSAIWKISVATTERIRVNLWKSDHRNPGLSLQCASKTLGSPQQQGSQSSKMYTYIKVYMYARTSQIMPFKYVQFIVYTLVELLKITQTHTQRAICPYWNNGVKQQLLILCES